MQYKFASDIHLVFFLTLSTALLQNLCKCGKTNEPLLTLLEHDQFLVRIAIVHGTATIIISNTVTP